MSATSITDQEEGKRVVDADGEKIGIVSGVREGTAYVDPEPGIGDQVKTMLGWESVDEEDYPLDRDMIDTIDDDEIRLERGT